MMMTVNPARHNSSRCLVLTLPIYINMTQVASSIRAVERSSGMISMQMIPIGMTIGMIVFFRSLISCCFWESSLATYTIRARLLSQKQHEIRER